jgi:hypothetical protein
MFDIRIIKQAHVRLQQRKQPYKQRKEGAKSASLKALVQVCL